MFLDRSCLRTAGAWEDDAAGLEKAHRNLGTNAGPPLDEEARGSLPSSSKSPVTSKASGKTSTPIARPDATTAAEPLPVKEKPPPLEPPPPLVETCGPTLLTDDMLAKSTDSEKSGIQVRLQCWDFPGQEEYALLNRLFFSERAIFLVFFDLTGKMEAEWRHISFWLWAIAKFSADHNAVPPVVLLGTKAGSKLKLDDLELQKRLEDLQKKIPHLKKQLQPHPMDITESKCRWLFPVENKTEKYEEWIRPLRSHLERMALQFVTPRDIWTADRSDGEVPGFVGMQKEPYPLAWLRAHDLLTQLGTGFRREASTVNFIVLALKLINLVKEMILFAKLQ